jgi:hypothetical protein
MRDLDYLLRRTRFFREPAHVDRSGAYGVVSGKSQNASTRQDSIIFDNINVANPEQLYFHRILKYSPFTD